MDVLTSARPKSCRARYLCIGLLLSAIALRACDAAKEYSSRKYAAPEIELPVDTQRTSLSSLGCELGPHDQCEASSAACCACANSECTTLTSCGSCGADCMSCPAESPEPACCPQESSARTLLQTKPAPPATPVGTCTWYINRIFRSSTSIPLRNTTATSRDDCLTQCLQYQGCNVFLYCPDGSNLYGAANCFDGFTRWPDATCNLFQEREPGGALLSLHDDYTSDDYELAGITLFTSGVCNPTLPTTLSPPPGTPRPPPPSLTPISTLRPPPPPPTPTPTPTPGPTLVFTPSSPSPPPPPTPVNPTPQSSSFPVGTVVGSVVGGVALIAVVAILTVGWVCVVKRRRSQPGRLAQPSKSFDPGNGNAFLETQSGGWSTTTFGALPKHVSPSASLDPKASRSTASGGSATANFFALEQEHGIQTVQLPEPWLGGKNTQNGVATIALNSQAEQPQEQFQTSELKDTWKLDPKDLTCRLREGKPIVLGEGGFGRVYWGQLHRADVAVKVVTSHTPKQQQSFLKEIHTLRACYNPHIVQFIGACVRETQTFMVMEFMPRGDLKGRLAQGGTLEFGWYSKGQRVALEILQGLIYLHSLDIAHLDLKSPNILLTAHDQAKIGDVGLGKMVRSPKAGPAQAASYLWAAPEQLVGGDVGKACDIFSVGTVLWEICTAETITQRYLRDVDVPSEAPQAVADVIRRCRSSDPSQRPTAEEVYDTLAAVKST